MFIDSLKTISVCLIIIILVIGLYWFKQKLQSNFKSSGIAPMRQVGTLNLGTHERLIVIEVSNRWIVIGVTAGRMVALAELDKPLPLSDTDTETATTHNVSFQSVVKTLGLEH